MYVTLKKLAIWTTRCISANVVEQAIFSTQMQHDIVHIKYFFANKKI